MATFSEPIQSDNPGVGLTFWYWDWDDFYEASASNWQVSGNTIEFDSGTFSCGTEIGLSYDADAPGADLRGADGTPVASFPRFEQLIQSKPLVWNGDIPDVTCTLNESRPDWLDITPYLPVDPPGNNFFMELIDGYFGLAFNSSTKLVGGTPNQLGDFRVQFRVSYYHDMDEDTEGLCTSLSNIVTFTVVS